MAPSLRCRRSCGHHPPQPAVPVLPSIVPRRGVRRLVAMSGPRTDAMKPHGGSALRSALAGRVPVADGEMARCCRPAPRSWPITPRRNTSPHDRRAPRGDACRAGTRRRDGGRAVRHGRAAHRLRAALVPGRDLCHDPARRPVVRGRSAGTARHLAGQRGPLLPGAGRRPRRPGRGGGVDHGRDRRPGPRARRRRDAGGSQPGGRGGGVRPAVRAGDVLAAPVR